jgi:parallel beta-helix repeat protein
MTTIKVDIPPIELGNVTNAGQKITVPLPNIVIPAQTVVLGSIEVTVPAQITKLPVLDIPPLNIEISDTPNPTPTPDPDPTPTPTPTPTPVLAKVLIYPNGNTYSAKNVATGVVFSSSSALATLFTAAENALTSGRTEKETILLQGTFNLTSSLMIENYTTLQLDGVISMPSNINTHMIIAVGKHHFTITGGEWNANKVVGSNPTDDQLWSSHALYVENCSYFNISNCKIHNVWETGIELMRSCHHATIDSNVIYDSNVNGIEVGLANNNIDITNNTITHCNYVPTDGVAPLHRGGGIYIYSNVGGTVVEAINIAGNKIVECGADGISLYPNTATSYVRNCLVDSNTIVDTSYNGMNAAISVGAGGSGGAPGTGSIGFCNNNTITNNVVYETGNYIHNGTSRNGGTCGFCYVRGTGNIVRNNIFRNSSRPCIAVFYGGNNVVDGNTIKNDADFVPKAGEDAIAINSSNNVISNNAIIKPGNYCVNVSSGNGNQVINNTFSNTTKTINNAGTNTVISGNITKVAMVL